MSSNKVSNTNLTKNNNNNNDCINLELLRQQLEENHANMELISAKADRYDMVLVVIMVIILILLFVVAVQHFFLKGNTYRKNKDDDNNNNDNNIRGGVCGNRGNYVNDVRCYNGEREYRPLTAAPTETSSNSSVRPHDLYINNNNNSNNSKSYNCDDDGSPPLSRNTDAGNKYVTMSLLFDERDDSQTHQLTSRGNNNNNNINNNNIRATHHIHNAIIDYEALGGSKSENDSDRIEMCQFPVITSDSERRTGDNNNYNNYNDSNTDFPGIINASVTMPYNASIIDKRKVANINNNNNNNNNNKDAPMTSLLRDFSYTSISSIMDNQQYRALCDGSDSLCRCTSEESIVQRRRQQAHRQMLFSATGMDYCQYNCPQGMPAGVCNNNNNNIGTNNTIKSHADLERLCCSLIQILQKNNHMKQNNLDHRSGDVLPSVPSNQQFLPKALLSNKSSSKSSVSNAEIPTENGANIIPNINIRSDIKHDINSIVPPIRAASNNNNNIYIDECISDPSPLCVPLGAADTAPLSIEAMTDGLMDYRVCNIVTMLRSGHSQRGKVIGSGSSGTVYTHLLWDGSFIALKTIDASGVADTTTSQVVNELYLISHLRSPHIIRYYHTEYDSSTQEILLYMEYVPGGSLRDMVVRLAAEEGEEGGRGVAYLDEHIAKGYIRQVLIALVYIHSKGIMHRDIKADNILVDGTTGMIKLADFGSAVALRRIESQANILRDMGNSRGSFRSPNSTSVHSNQGNVLSDRSITSSPYTSNTGGQTPRSCLLSISQPQLSPSPHIADKGERRRRIGVSSDVTKSDFFKFGIKGAATTVGTPLWMAPEVVNPDRNLDKNSSNISSRGDIKSNDTPNTKPSHMQEQHHSISSLVQPSTRSLLSSKRSTLSSKGEYGSKADIWSLGITTVELLNRGNPPWEFDFVWEALQFIGNLTESPPLPIEVKRRLSPKGVSFIEKCLTIDPVERPSAFDLLSDPWLVDAEEDYTATSTTPSYRQQEEHQHSPTPHRTAIHSDSVRNLISIIKRDNKDTPISTYSPLSSIVKQEQEHSYIPTLTITPALSHDEENSSQWREPLVPPLQPPMPQTDDTDRNQITFNIPLSLKHKRPRRANNGREDNIDIIDKYNYSNTIVKKKQTLGGTSGLTAGVTGNDIFADFDDAFDLKI